MRDCPYLDNGRDKLLQKRKLQQAGPIVMDEVDNQTLPPTTLISDIGQQANKIRLSFKDLIHAFNLSFMHNAKHCFALKLIKELEELLA